MAKVSDILELIVKSNDNGISPKQLSQQLKISPPAVQSHLKKLIEAGEIIKVGKTPQVFYKVRGIDGQFTQASANTDSQQDALLGLIDAIKSSRNTFAHHSPISQIFSPLESSLKIYSEAVLKLQNELKEDKSPLSHLINHFAYLDPNGNYLTGFDGFENWYKSQNKKESESDLILKFSHEVSKINQLRSSNNLIEAKSKIKENFGQNKIFLDKLYYLDIYSYPLFGRTKIALLAFQAKQSQNKDLARILLSQIKIPILEFVNQSQFDVVGFIPPSIPRNFQFMNFWESELNIQLPKLIIQKFFPGGHPIQQKSQKTTEERRINAENTFRIETISDLNILKKANLKCLLIDDFVGSGASLNIVAGKIKKLYPNIKIIEGLAIAGNIKDFPVVKEM